MCKTFFLLASCLAFTFLCPAQKKIVVVIGSSTAQGAGAQPIDSSWVNRTKKYLKDLGAIDTIYNLALGGRVTYAGMPTGWVLPPGRVFPPDPDRNVTKALTFNPDVVVVNFPTNDVGTGYPLSETLFNLRVIYNTVVDAGKQCFITTTQPRTSYWDGGRLLLKEERDSILAEFGVHALNFFDPIASADGLTINPLYNSGDDTHPNNAGHRLLFQAAVNANILPGVSLPLTLTSFTAEWKQQAVFLHWEDANEEDGTDFVIERSFDGVSFTAVMEEKGQGSPLPAFYSWTDNNPLTGHSYYRLKITEKALTHYSRVVAVDKNAVKDLSLEKIYQNDKGAGVIAELSIRNSQLVQLTIFNAAGMEISRQSYNAVAPFARIPVTLPSVHSGLYFLKVSTANGDVTTKLFSTF